MAELKQAAKLRLQRIDERIAELRRVRDGLEQLVSHCPGHGELCTCPILNALTED
jgi:MerR family copper efflux transcriptional regulator